MPSIVFEGLTQGGNQHYLFRQVANGSEEPEMLMSDDSGEEEYPGSWMPHGKGVVSVRSDGLIRLIPVDGSEPTVLIRGVTNTLSASLSPDGRRIAFDDSSTGDFEIYVLDLSDPSIRVVVSSGGGRNPQWSPDGRELYYHNDGRMMAVSVPQSAKEKFRRPRVLFETDIDWRFRLDPNGGFYGYRPVPGMGIHQDLKLILNWETLASAHR